MIGPLKSEAGEKERDKVERERVKELEMALQSLLDLQECWSDEDIAEKKRRVAEARTRVLRCIWNLLA